MLMGHSYLLAPAMALTPLLCLIGLLFVSIAVRAGIGGASLWLFWTAEHSLTNVMEVLLWLPVRWGLGLLLPFVLGVMAWKTARIRSTQSATGILYVVVIFCFLGELLSLGQLPAVRERRGAACTPFLPRSPVIGPKKF